MLYKPLKSLFFGLLGLTLAAASPNFSIADEAPVKIGPLEFRAPEGFHTVKSSDPRVLIILRRADGDYPTFNIIVRERGLGEGGASKDQQIKAILDSYASVGFSDAAQAGETSNIAGNRGLTAFDISYASTGKKFLATVLEFESEGKIFTATIVNQADSGAEAYKQMILRGFTGTIPSEATTSSSLLAFIVILAGLSAAALLIAALRRRARAAS